MNKNYLTEEYSKNKTKDSFLKFSLFQSLSLFLFAPKIKKILEEYLLFRTVSIGISLLLKNQVKVPIFLSFKYKHSLIISFFLYVGH